jgi:mannose/cellobiose epimerase-like protein (N-acyl-D-glucosamine 2-epimerase family)
MSRFLYGLSSSYLLTGNNRAFSAASACAKYLINAFSVLTHDHLYCFWKFGRQHDGKSTKDILSSENGDDKGSYALYEQIYALAGLTQYYRITQDTGVLFYITRSINAFEKFFLDEKREGDACFTGAGGYFSHIDPVTMRPDTEKLGQNRMRKNWNSIGDHIPAYLVNLLLAIDPLPVTSGRDSWERLLKLCRKILDECVDNIITHFPPTDDSKFVNERFHADWSVDHEWGWQKNRGIVGHNLKISWNLTRCGHYYEYLIRQAQQNGSSAKKYQDLSKRCYETARMLGKNMEEAGVDLIRGGIYDALERNPSNGMPTEFAWETTKDFWQQEQAILAYYIMSGIPEQYMPKEEGTRFLELGRYCAAFWNLFFVDQENRKIYFRTTESGVPVVQDGYGIQGGHAIAGYHSFELNYLAHLYIRTYVSKVKGQDESFCLVFQPKNCEDIKSFNVLPDFFRPEELKIIGIKFNGTPQDIRDSSRFQIDITGIEPGTKIEVEFMPLRRETPDVEQRLRKEREGTVETAYGRADY